MLRLNIEKTLALFIEKKATPATIANDCFSQLEKTKHLNAFITINEKNARAEAEKLSQLKSTQKELQGIPIAIKDNFCTANIRTTCGAKMLENFVPTYNATVYERLKDAGAVLIGKCNLDQFAMGSGTVDSIYGPTKNCWGVKESNEDFYVAGGSSGGCAVAVASGTCLGAIGSDTGGSTRNPASYCGLVGLKPTYGSVSRHGLISLVNSMDVPGILTRSVDDCAAILNVIMGHDPKDATTIQRRYRKINVPDPKRVILKNLKVGIPKEYHCEGLSDEVRNTWNEIANALQQSGAEIRQVSLPHTEHSIVCYSILNQCEVSSNMARYDGIEFGHRADTEKHSTEELYATSRREGFNEVVRNRILAGNYFLLRSNYKYFEKALKVRRLIANDFDNVWSEVNILLTPTTLTTAPMYSDFIKKNNRDQCAMQDYCTQPANMAGIPALSLPIKLSNTGMPVSLQLMGPNFSEATLLTVAKFIEHIVQFPVLHSTQI